jgi:HEAT repeat protein
MAIAACLVTPCAVAQTAPDHAEAIRNLRNPDTRARLSALRTLRDAQHVPAAIPVAALVVDPVDAVQLEAIAAELSFYVVREAPVRRRVGLIVEVRSKGQAAQLFERGVLATWPDSAPAEVVDALIRAVDDENPRVRMEAIHAVGVIARPPLSAAAARGLITALDHYDPAVRAAAARVAGRLRVQAAGEALIKGINDPVPAVRFASMRALGDIREPRAVRALTEQLEHYGKGEGAWSALDGLARIGHASSAVLFRARLADKDPFLRRAAAEGLGRVGEASSAAAIQAAEAAERSDMARAAMAFALVKLGHDYLPQLLDRLGSDRTRTQVEDYLLELGPSVLPALTARFNDPVAGVRAGAVEVTGVLGTSDSVTALEPLLKDRDREVAEAAMVAIERIKMRR